MVAIPKAARPGLRLHRQRVGVLEAERSKDDDAVPMRLSVGGQFPQNRLSPGIVLAPEHVGPQRAGIVDVDVQLTGGQGAIGGGRAEILFLRPRARRSASSREAINSERIACSEKFFEPTT